MSPINKIIEKIAKMISLEKKAAFRTGESMKALNELMRDGSFEHSKKYIRGGRHYFEISEKEMARFLKSIIKANLYLK